MPDHSDEVDVKKKEPTANQLLDAVDDARARLMAAERKQAWFVRGWVFSAVLLPSGGFIAAVCDPNTLLGGWGVVMVIIALAIAFILGCVWSDSGMTGDVAAARNAVKTAERAHRDFDGPFI